MGTWKKILTITVGVCISSVAYATEIVFDQQLAVSHCTDKWTKRGVLNGGMLVTAWTNKQMVMQKPSICRTNTQISRRSNLLMR